MTQLVLAVMLLDGTGLIVSSFLRLASVDPGFQPRSVLSFRVELPEVRYDSPERVGGFLDEFLSGVGRLPGVR